MKYFVLYGLMILPILGLSQVVDRDNISNVLNIGLEYGYQIPGGDLADRFGNSTVLGAKVEYLMANNLSVSGHFSFNFGRNVKEDPTASLRDSDGILLGANFAQANIFLRERGLYFGLSVGKLFPLLKNNKRSGLKLDLGFGLFQHNIRIQEDPESFVPILGGDYTKGFDRLSNGLALREFIGYQHLSRNRLTNFYAGVELTQAFTQNRRSYNYDAMSADDSKRLDLVTAFKVGWIIPIYIGEEGGDIYY